jgi:hypothetical protein
MTVRPCHRMPERAIDLLDSSAEGDNLRLPTTGCGDARVLAAVTTARAADWDRSVKHQVGSASILWVPDRRRRLCDLPILVDEAVASVASSDLVELGSTAVGEWA